jgi:molybdenum cofactor cytidylyltransferase
VAAVEGILLAAGESRRMGFPKPLLRLNTHTFIEHTARAMLEAVSRLVIVLGAGAERVRAAVPCDPRIAIVENSNWQRGQLSSLRAGLAALSKDASASLVHLADHPTVLPATFAALVHEYERSRKPILIARHDAHRGHPVIFARTIFGELKHAPDEAGARAVVNADPSRVAYLDVEDPGVALDLDTPADLARAGLPAPPKQ